MTGRVDFLAQLPIFAALDEEELYALAEISHEYEFDNGAVIVYQRDVADSMYIVRSGHLYAYTVDSRGVVRDTKRYLPGDYFGTRWLFAPDTHRATVKGSGDGRVIIIKGSDFLQFLDENPNALANLEPFYDETGTVVEGLPEPAWQEAQKVRLKADPQSAAVSLLPEELVEYQSRRSLKYLLLREIGPVLGLIILPLLSYSLLAGQEGTIWVSLSVAVPVLLALIFGLIVGFQLLDWSNDYFVITNKHLTHREFDLRTFRINLNKIPVHQIQSVEILKPDLLSNLLNIGTARVTTAARTGTILFDKIDDPIIVKQTLDRLSQRVKAMDAGRAQAAMRQSIESYFQADPPYREVEDEEEMDAYSPPPQKPGFFASLLKQYRGRVEEGNVVTYRKHVFVLFREILWPAAAALLLFLIAFSLVRFFGYTIGQIWSTFLIFTLVDVLWLIWQTEDWRNDTFQITNRVVIDIDRRPFGFGESRKQAPLGNIQNVNADRPGLLPTLFNYGFVYIETAGADSDITFENVVNPSRVQSDIFRRLDQIREQQRLKEGERRREEYAVLLDVYKQAEEQGRIPRRTPPDEAEVQLG